LDISLYTPEFLGFSVPAGGYRFHAALTPESPRRCPFGNFAVRFPCSQGN
jgi:hypothetical protein